MASSPVPSSEVLKSEVFTLLQDRDLVQITLKTFRRELEKHFSLEPGSLEARKDEVTKVVKEVTEYFCVKEEATDHCGPASPSPVICHPGVVLGKHQPRTKVAFSAGVEALTSFSVDFCVSISAVKVDDTAGKHLKVLSHCSGGRGFRFELHSGRITLMLLADIASTEVAAELAWEDRLNDWIRLTATVQSWKAQQTARLLVDGNLCTTKMIPQSSRYVDCEQRFLLLGCPDLEMEIKELTLFSGAVSEQDIIASTQRELSHEHLKATSETLWVDRCFTDCEILADDGRRWTAHRSILAAGSPVFRRMLESEMQESCDKPVITLRHSAGADIEAFLYFLYVGQLPAKGSAMDEWSRGGVLELADMYDVQRLVKTICVEIESSISPQSIGQALQFMKRRQATPAIDETYKRVRRRVHQDKDLLNGLMDHV